jgi:hypothetical protein
MIMAPVSTAPITIAQRRELFVDDLLIENIKGARLRLHAPILTPPSRGRARVVYSTILHEDGLFRRYQRDVRPEYRGERFDGHPGEITRYLESRDGIRWRRPDLDVLPAAGKGPNNLVLAGNAMSSHNFTPFIDLNPQCRPARRYKALGGVHAGGGLYAWTSGDGFRWRKLRSAPVITSNAFAFDSQNVAFWSPAEGQYVCYFRTWDTPHGHLRSISRATSDDFVNWSKPVAMNPNLPGEHLYTSGTHPYCRAPHIYLALPTRFVPQRGSSTDILFMSSRPGDQKFCRLFTEAFIRPGLNESRWGNRANYAAWNVVQTSSEELSIYVNDRRYILRPDGFVSLQAGAAGGELLTRPLRFDGDELELNYSTSAAGQIRVEIRDKNNRPIDGLRLRDCQPTVGDNISGRVSWKKEVLGKWAGKAVRLRFVLEDADLFSFRFRHAAD